MSDFVKEASSDTFRNIIDEGITLVDFWAPWCGPCKMQLSILDELAVKIKGKAKIAKINIDESADIAGQYSVQAIPTLVLFKEGIEINRFIGLQQKETLIEAISSNM